MKNDIISRSALRKDLEVTQYNDSDDLTRTERLINNAKTVEVPENTVDCVLTMFGNCSYNETGCSDCEIKDKIRKALNDRPAGEWIIDGHHYKCSRCGKTLAIMFSETDDDLIGCPFCLADMRGGAE